MLLLVLFIAVLVLAVLLQQKTVDLVKEMNPEKKGSIYDEKFQKLWWESCDEAERRQIGQASYKAYSTASKFCAYFWGALFLGNMIFDYGLSARRCGTGGLGRADRKLYTGSCPAGPPGTENGIRKSRRKDRRLAVFSLVYCVL